MNAAQAAHQSYESFKIEYTLHQPIRQKLPDITQLGPWVTGVMLSQS